MTRTLFASALLALAASATPAMAWTEFTSETAKQRFDWGRANYSYYCPIPAPAHLRNVRFEDLNFFAQGALAFVTKQKIADYIQDNCGQGQSVAAQYVGGN